ncbi:hypothetical protein STIAU_2092 [Stigmatella aurantiaca DW4/3-1]|uniref:Uncharacterized protein n=1 Tax=Stigmatella aurantiaca (strain DW4/3-1) TaxID=378806 RepID=Q09CN6_STIAD|nr:hypothetical protein STIAU_2092 [Stigmatella aurantiaca DW4/3-1]
MKSSMIFGCSTGRSSCHQRKAASRRIPLSSRVCQRWPGGGWPVGGCMTLLYVRGGEGERKPTGPPATSSEQAPCSPGKATAPQKFTRTPRATAASTARWRSDHPPTANSSSR